MSTATGAAELARGRVCVSIVAILFAVTMVNYRALAFFGKGVGASGWAVVVDTAPKQIAGLAGGSFNGVLVFVGANSLVAILSYLLIEGEIRRFELKRPQEILA